MCAIIDGRWLPCVDGGSKFSLEACVNDERKVRARIAVTEDDTIVPSKHALRKD